MLIKILFIILIGLSAGGVTATGLFALISSIGLINRYADVTGRSASRYTSMPYWFWNSRSNKYVI